MNIQVTEAVAPTVSLGLDYEEINDVLTGLEKLLSVYEKNTPIGFNNSDRLNTRVMGSIHSWMDGLAQAKEYLE